MTCTLRESLFARTKLLMQHFSGGYIIIIGQPTHVAHHSSLFGSRACSIECRTAQPIITAFDVNGTGKEVKMTPGQLKVAVLKSLLVNPFEKVC